MRSFRTAAVAGLTAVALAAGSASVATAAETETDTQNLSSTFSALSSGGAAEAGRELDADQPVKGEDIFGEENKLDDENTPAWAKTMYDLTVLGGIASLLGVIVFPAYNYLVYTGVIKG